jgi:hypothetical protein
MVFSTMVGAAGSFLQGALLVLPHVPHGACALQGALQTTPHRPHPMRLFANEWLVSAQTKAKAATNDQDLVVCMANSNSDSAASLTIA